MHAQPNTIAVDDAPLPGRNLSNRARQPLHEQWAALHDAAAAVAVLAGLAPGQEQPTGHDFPDRIEAVGGWRLELAADLVDDLSAMMRPGVAALLAVGARGQDATAAAVTLWREFHHARSAVLALLARNEA